MYFGDAIEEYFYKYNYKYKIINCFVRVLTNGYVKN